MGIEAEHKAGMDRMTGVEENAPKSNLRQAGKRSRYEGQEDNKGNKHADEAQEEESNLSGRDQEEGPFTSECHRPSAPTHTSCLPRFWWSSLVW